MNYLKMEQGRFIVIVLDSYGVGYMDDVLEELADVTNYCLQMAQVLDVDIIDIINRKMDDTEKKYPVGKARGVSTKYDKL